MSDSLTRRLASALFKLGPHQYITSTPERYGQNLDKYRIQEDAAFDPARERCLDGDLTRFYFFGMVFDLIRRDKSNGDIAELGVYKGYSARLFAEFARTVDKQVYLLDTFEGFADADIVGEEHLKGAFSDTSREGVQALVGTKNCHYVKGYFPDTADQLPSDGQYCLVHIDCDLYMPVLSALTYFYDRVVDGGFLIMHDYMSLSWDGPIRAVDEFFRDKPESIIPIPDYAGTVLIRKMRRQ
ncbi:TylF/MycF/NovP-related O-methyltransferase [Segnochrobactrum spirostomi]|uniref:Methyltransferase n=1 Tax=Segnochrobactrum spirostomi TaxID=2608987 RepID=A0A6A7Y008_9HYPH|nr:TylF/MycF/NovP-related O-methyltransferase [Segnochrobactrum spirostomi]MQT11152.1 hypothetical protein [Segnochrobactrum spirostomi]